MKNKKYMKNKKEDLLICDKGVSPSPKTQAEACDFT
jgi:hypothetical protein